VRAAPQVTVVQGTGGTGRRIGCFENTPVPVRVALTNGGTAVLCTRGDGTLEGARAPVYPPGSGVAPSLDQPGHPVTARTADRAAPAPVAVAAAPAPAPAVAPPPGYRAAWEDDRLNPDRGPRTAEGQAQQDRVWTRDVPAVAAAAPQATVSSKSEPQGGGSLYVQVGSFGVPSNAQNARATLRALGLPTARAQAGGLTVVLAGPFGSAADARAALGAARGAGFGDAFIR
jgi:cell division protein FtsN